MPAVIPSAEYKSEVTSVMSEKRLVRARGQALRLPNTGLAGPWRAMHRFALTHRLFFRVGAGTISNSLAFTFVRLHGKPYRLFFEREFEWSVRAFACKQQPVCLHANTHRLFFRAEAGTISNSLAFTFVRLHGKPYRLFFERGAGMVCSRFCVQAATRSPSCAHASIIFSGRSTNGIAQGNHLSPFFYLPPSVGLLLTVRTRFICTRDRVWEGIFAAEHRLLRAILERHHARATSELAGWRSSLPFVCFFYVCLVLHGLY